MKRGKKQFSSLYSSLKSPLYSSLYEETFYEGPPRSESLERPGRQNENVGVLERGTSMILGGLIGGYAVRQLTRKNWISGGLTMLAGGALLHRGGTGMCAFYKAMGINTAEKKDASTTDGFRVEKSIVIENTPTELFQFWRKLENLPQIMSHLTSVKALSDGTSHWTAEAAPGMEVSWDAEIIGEQENRFISWRSLPGSQIESEGTVSFEGLNDNEETIVTVSISYKPPGGSLAVAVAKFFGRDAESEIEGDLEVFKHYMESGAFPWDEEIPHSRRRAASVTH